MKKFKLIAGILASVILFPSFNNVKARDLTYKTEILDDIYLKKQLEEHPEYGVAILKLNKNKDENKDEDENKNENKNYEPISKRDIALDILIGVVLTQWAAFTVLSASGKSYEYCNDIHHEIAKLVLLPTSLALSLLSSSFKSKNHSIQGLHLLPSWLSK